MYARKIHLDTTRKSAKLKQTLKVTQPLLQDDVEKRFEMKLGTFDFHL